MALPVLSNKPPIQPEHFNQQNQTHDNGERIAQMQARGGGQTYRTGDAIQISVPAKRVITYSNLYHATC